jgi:phosphoribosylformylglycinamidine cyclo-ligase
MPYVSCMMSSGSPRNAMNDHAYREAGVDIDLESTAITALVKNLTYRRRGSFPVLGDVGHYAGLIDCGKRVLALTTDGVGTKMLVADHLRNWKTVGIDCIAMNVNDLYVMNVEPVAFVDYIATDQLSPEKMSQIGIGLNEGARQANINIVGGETATLRGLVSGLDLAGTCLGIQEKDRIITGESIRPGDRIIGVPSSGIHSNGLTLARKVVERYSDYNEPFGNGRTLGEELLVPTRIYHETIALTRQTPVHGMCHITGGGLKNLLRLSRYGYDITSPLPPQPIFTWIAESAGITGPEMYRTFNMGMGFAFIVPDESVTTMLSGLPGAGIVGEVTGSPGVRLRGEEIR